MMAKLTESCYQANPEDDQRKISVQENVQTVVRVPSLSSIPARSLRLVGPDKSTVTAAR